MITMILKEGGVVKDKDLLSPKAAKELIIAAVTGIVPDAKEADRQIQDILNAIQQGNTVEIKNPHFDTSLVFQFPNARKENLTRH